MHFTRYISPVNLPTLNYMTYATYIYAMPYRLLDSLVVESWLWVREVPGSTPSQGPRHTKDVIKLVPEVPLFCTQHWKGKYWLFLKNYDKKIMQWIKSGIEHPSKSEVIGRCGGDEKTEWLRRTDKSRTLKKVPCRIYRVSRLQFA